MDSENLDGLWNRAASLWADAAESAPLSSEPIPSSHSPLTEAAEDTAAAEPPGDAGPLADSPGGTVLPEDAAGDGVEPRYDPLGLALDNMAHAPSLPETLPEDAAMASGEASGLSLEPVAEDASGTVQPIDDLDYRPETGDWTAELPSPATDPAFATEATEAADMPGDRQVESVQQELAQVESRDVADEAGNTGEPDTGQVADMSDLSATNNLPDFRTDPPISDSRLDEPHASSEDPLSVPLPKDWGWQGERTELVSGAGDSRASGDSQAQAMPQLKLPDGFMGDVQQAIEPQLTMLREATARIMGDAIEDQAVMSLLGGIPD